MAYQPRIPYRFTSADGTTQVATFPTLDFEWEISRGLYAPSVALHGAEFDYDLLGEARAAQQSPVSRLRYIVRESAPDGVDDTVEAIDEAIIEAKKGKLWTTDKDGVLRWAWARPLALPDLRWSAGDIFRKASGIEFRIDSPFYDSAETTGTGDADAGSVTITNPGNAPVYNAVFILRGTFTNPEINNTTNGMAMVSTRDGSSSAHYLKFDAGANSIEWSTDSGGSYADDRANFVRSLGQGALMVLEPGDNVFSFAGVTNGSFDYAFRGAWRL